MYGKIYPSMFTGSMCGSGATAFAVFTYAIVNARPDCGSSVSLNPIALSGIIGEDPEEIENAILELCRPDAKSRSDAEGGRRLVRIGTSMDYKVVNLEKYRFLDTEDQKTYWRERKREQRNKSKSKRVDNQQLSGTNVDSPRNVPKCPHADADADADAGTKSLSSKEIELPANFPETVNDAIQRAATITNDIIFITDLWNSAMSNMGIDGKSVPIHSWVHYVAKCWSREVGRRAENKANGNVRPGHRDPSDGTFYKDKPPQFESDKFYYQRKTP